MPPAAWFVRPHLICHWYFDCIPLEDLSALDQLACFGETNPLADILDVLGVG